MSRPSYLSRVENRRSTLRVLPNYTYGFCRWLGTPLSTRHKAIIEHIERTRQQATALNPPRIIVEDPDPATSGIPQLLILYFQWLATRILPHRRAALVNNTKTLPRNDNHLSPAFNPQPPTYKAYKAYPPYLTYSPYKSPSKNSALCPLNFALSKNSALTTCSARRTDLLRGQSFDLILMLNCHAYSRRGTFASRGDDFYLYGVDNFNDILRTLLPMLPQHREGIIIIHGRPNRRVTGFQSLRRKTLAGFTSYTLLNPNITITDHRPVIKPIETIHPIKLKAVRAIKAIKAIEAMKAIGPIKAAKPPQSIKLPHAAVAPAA